MLIENCKNGCTIRLLSHADKEKLSGTHSRSDRKRQEAMGAPLIVVGLSTVPVFNHRGFNLPFPSRAASEVQQPHSLMLAQTREALTEALFEYGDVS